MWSMESFNAYVNDRFRVARGLPRDWVLGAFTVSAAVPRCSSQGPITSVNDSSWSLQLIEIVVGLWVMSFLSEVHSVITEMTHHMCLLGGCFTALALAGTVPSRYPYIDTSGVSLEQATNVHFVKSST